MPTYRYSGIDLNGHNVKGSIHASSVNDLYAKLSSNEVYVKNYVLTANDDASGTRKPTLQELSIFTNKLASMLANGLNLPNSLKLLYSSEKKKNLKNLYLSLYENTQKGLMLSTAMKASSFKMPLYLMEMVMAGERAGNLEENLSRVSLYYEKESKAASKMLAALLYPILLLIVTLIVVLILVVFALPKFMSMFNGYDIPWNTRLLINLSNFLINDYQMIIIVLTSLILGLHLFYKKPENRVGYDKFKLNFPIFGNLYKTIITSRFARTFASLYASGIPILEALSISSNVVNNTYVSKELEGVSESLKRGDTLSEAIKKQNVFDELLYSMIYVGEESGDLPELLNTVANYFDDASDSASEKIQSLIQPIVIVLMALIIGFIVYSIIVPIYEMMGSIV